MENDIFTKKPPKKYIEGFVTYIPDIIDGNINLLGFLGHGYTMKEANRMLALYRIESLKYHLEEGKKEYNPTDEEIAEFEALIEKRIEDYNKEGEAS